MDQRWVDFAPCFVSRLGVLRDDAYNVAYWNLFHRELSELDGEFLVNGRTLRFFHFSGFDPDNTDCLSRHQSRFQMSELPAVKRLAQQYSRLLHDYGYERCHRWPYAYGYFSNGVRIPDLGRPLHQECPGITKTITDPFSEEGYRAFVAIWNEPVDRTVNGRPAITRLAYRLYRTRHDLQGAMPNVFNGDYRGFVQWLTSNAAGDHDLPDIFLAPFRTDAVSREKSEGFDATAVSEPCLGPLTTASTHAGKTQLNILSGY